MLLFFYERAKRSGAWERHRVHSFTEGNRNANAKPSKATIFAVHFTYLYRSEALVILPGSIVDRSITGKIKLKSAQKRSGGWERHRGHSVQQKAIAMLIFEVPFSVGGSGDITQLHSRQVHHWKNWSFHSGKIVSKTLTTIEVWYFSRTFCWRPMLARMKLRNKESLQEKFRKWYMKEGRKATRIT